MHADDGLASQLQISEQHGVVRRLWQGGTRHLSALFAAPDNTARRPSIEDWDGFASRPREWAQSLTGVTEQAIQIWMPSTRNTELDGPALPPQPTLEWDIPPINPRARQDCAKQVTTWIAVARDLQARCQRRRGRLGARDRKEALRRMDLKTWAKSLRPNVGRLRLYSPEWVLDPDGRRRRPATSTDAMEGAAQEWERLFHDPPVPWQHPAFVQWVDPMGNRRGGLNFEYLVQAQAGGSEINPRAILEPGPWKIITWRPHQLHFLSDICVSIPGWVLSFCGSLSLWQAQRPGPCPGAPLHILSFGAMPSHVWTMDHFHPGIGAAAASYAIALENNRFADRSALQRLEPEHRDHWIRKMRWSRPGRTGFKVAFLPLLPVWCQELFWELTDMQRALATIAPSNKRAVQINLPKSSGGWRPLSMMEEAFKVIEGPVTHRISTARSLLTHGQMYSGTNLAYEKHQAATSEVLYTDCIICEIAVRSGSPFVRIPSDYEKYFNSLVFEEVDAMQLARGVPDMVRRFYTDAFQKITVAVETRWGNTRELEYKRGVPQGTISSPELSKPAQEPILRMRELSPVHFITDHGIAVAVAAYADDAEHYAGGIQQLPLLLRELGAGSMLAGVGYAWKKFSVYASDWDSVVGTEWAAERGVTQDGVRASGYDIWTGNTIHTTLPRSHVDTVETLLGKRGSIGDKHATAAQDLLDKLSALRRKLTHRNCDWDEVAAAFQLIGRGYISYAPLIGIPCPLSLHMQDTDLQLLILKRLQVRCSVERVSLLAARGSGGLQMPSMVECMVTAVASDLLLLMNGNTTASHLARAELRVAMQVHPAEASAQQGIVCRAMLFLAGYGIYLAVSSERFLSRLLDHLKVRLGSAHALLVGPADEWSHQQGRHFCRVGRFANAMRRALVTLQRDFVVQQWDSVQIWQQLLDPVSGLSPSDCAAATQAALTSSRSDWAVECHMFHRPLPNALPDEDWAEEAWSSPWAANLDSRSAYLDAPTDAAFSGLDFGMYSDGGMTNSNNCTFCSQARSFGALGAYWDSSSECTERLISRLPSRFGYEDAGVHEAELAAMLTALRWRQPDGWNLVVVDRSSLCNVLQQASLGRPHALRGLSSHFLVGRLQRVLVALRDAWRESTPKPSWRLQQEARPEIWNCKLHDKWMCKITHCTAGLVVVDIKSHQVHTNIPHPVITRGNEQQDAGCTTGRSKPLPPDVKYPTGGLFAFMVMGR